MNFYSHINIQYSRKKKTLINVSLDFKDISIKFTDEFTYMYTYYQKCEDFETHILKVFSKSENVSRTYLVDDFIF